ncbi:Methionine--tRNA ligase, mitochondrial [Hondaea fermentalgiana]|uniref:methionine--tRNA ligase n=1 Tax=Hondaea fermentalgiana TaxID=2315210 RepID=A0A2R5G9V5_9STRA|nr:Methionine--tRNA ligase, mitochondrial [Hondaea fermentalgiana]|eukprot:GBG25313.1 Methionine--tRNA ligase, mitochondrial [Hondaea fermentalgiana]
MLRACSSRGLARGATRAAHGSGWSPRTRTRTCTTTSTASSASATAIVQDKQKKLERVLVTTPIFYVNGSPHIGHAYSGLLADALARWLRLEGHEVLFTTGTDEHGAKVERAGIDKGAASTKDYCDGISQEFRELFEALGTSHDDFIRTTEPRHGANVAALWERLQSAGFINLGEHQGWYCQSDEAFLTDKQVADQGDGKMVSLESGHAVEWVSESNYVFPLSQFHERLLEWLSANEKVAVQPSTRWNEVDAFLRQEKADGKPELDDLSVSRPRDRVRWAWPVPTDDQHSVYVWLDALANYLTASGVKIPADPDQAVSWRDAGVDRVIHVIGKDILRFHTVYWPAFLMAAGIETPDVVFAHGHWTVERTKMSKSLGNVVNPMDLVAAYGVDAVRYSLLRNGSIGADLDFSNEMLESRRRDELINTYGNLLARCTGKSLAPDDAWPGPAANTRPQDSDLASNHLSGLADVVGSHFARLEFARGAGEIMDVLYEANRVVTAEEPWVLRKKLRQDPDAPEADDLRAQLDTTMYWVLETLRVTSILLQPIVPEAAGRALDALGIPAAQRSVADARRVGDTSLKSLTMQRPKKGSVVLIPPLPKPDAQA